MNFKLKDIVPQLITVIAVVLVFGFFTYNAQINMENRGIDFGYGFLSQESSFDVQFSLIEYDGSHSYFRAYLVGLLNTILVSVIGIVIATILGFYLSDYLNKDMLMGLAILNPIYFTCMMVGAMKTVQVTLAVILGAVLGPVFYFFSPEWSILLGGLIAGSVAFLIGEKNVN